MAETTRVLFWRHLRSETSSHVIHARNGRTVRSGRGLSFWFLPLSASVAELPMDDRELSLVFHGRAKDFQDVTVEGVVVWRVADPEALAGRVDFTIDAVGRWTRQPLEKIGGQLTQLAQQLCWSYLVNSPLEAILRDGVDALQGRIATGLGADPSVKEAGIGIVTVGITAIRPTAEVEKALQTPTREAIQQEADKATFERRAIAVERERAIAENELQNQIELAKREETLIGQRGQNERRRVTDEAAAKRIQVEAAAQRAHIEHTAQAEGIRLVGAAQAEAEQSKIAIYQDLPSHVLMGLAARDLANHLPAIQNLQISPDMLGPVLARLAEAGTRKLESETAPVRPPKKA